jgi:hypothetical protein
LANNRDLQIEVLASMSMQANVCDRPDEAINLAESAKTIGRTAEARVRSLLAMRVAIAAARKRDEGLFQSARSEAWDLLESAREYDHPAWFNFFDERELIGLEALSLMRLDRHEEAANILNGVVGHKTNYVRNRAYYATVQAKAFIGAGKPESAVMTLRDNALPVLTEVTSKRTLDWLNKVRTGLQPFVARNADIEECCEALNDFLL